MYIKWLQGIVYVQVCELGQARTKGVESLHNSFKWQLFIKTAREQKKAMYVTGRKVKAKLQTSCQ